MPKRPLSLSLLGLLCLLFVFSGCGGGGSSAPVSSATGSDCSTNGNTIVADAGTTGTNGSTGNGPPFTQNGTPLANVRLPTGDWGGAENMDGPSHPASLAVSDDGLRLALYCGTSAKYTGPITLDASGHFEVTGTGHVRTNPLEPAESGKVLLSGTVMTSISDGKSTTNMILEVSDPVTGDGSASYVLFLGGSASAYEGLCPGP